MRDRRRVTADPEESGTRIRCDATPPCPRSSACRGRRTHRDPLRTGSASGRDPCRCPGSPPRSGGSRATRGSAPGARGPRRPRRRGPRGRVLPSRCACRSRSRARPTSPFVRPGRPVPHPHLGDREVGERVGGHGHAAARTSSDVGPWICVTQDCGSEDDDIEAPGMHLEPRDELAVGQDVPEAVHRSSG